MSPKEKALEIYNKMDWFTHGYVGSSMLSNTEFDDVKIKNTKAAAMVVIDEVILSSPRSPLFSDKYDKKSDSFVDMSTYEYWTCVKEELNNL